MSSSAVLAEAASNNLLCTYSLGISHVELGPGCCVKSTFGPWRKEIGVKVGTTVKVGENVGRPLFLTPTGPPTYIYYLHDFYTVNRRMSFLTAATLFLLYRSDLKTQGD